MKHLVGFAAIGLIFLALVTVGPTRPTGKPQTGQAETPSTYNAEACRTAKNRVVVHSQGLRDLDALYTESEKSGAEYMRRSENMRGRIDSAQSQVNRYCKR